MTRAIAIVVALSGLLGLPSGLRPAASANVRTSGPPVIHITAQRFEFTPSEITLRRGEPVLLEITSLDRDHGFKVPELGVRVDVKPGETTTVRVVPDRTGRFEFRCDVFCGSGHEDMAGELIVVD
jgi:cytochrome c oxidase subunit 2